MFQIWLGSFRKCRVQQIPALQLSSSNKEQVLLKLHIFTMLTCKNNINNNNNFCHFPNEPACNVLYLNSVETESLTGPEAVSKATKFTLSLNPRPVATMVHFKVSSQGITLTDSKRRYLWITTMLHIRKSVSFT